VKIVKIVSEDEVWIHWKKVEGHISDQFRWDIRGRLPDDIQWYLAEIEEEDIEKIFIISSDDWRAITRTFRVIDSVNSLYQGIIDEKTDNILRKKALYEKDLDALDRKFILVSPSIEGNFTIIEGNKRVVALHSINRLIGNRIYLGISKKIIDYVWARYSR